VFDSKGGASAATKLAQINGQIVTAEGTLQAKKKELSALDLEERELQAELMEVEDELSSLGAVDPAKLEQSQIRRSQIAEAKGELESKLRDSWESGIPLGLLGGFRAEFHSYLIMEEKRREWETSKSAVEPKIPQVKKDVFEGIEPSFTLHPDFQNYYANRLEDALKKMFNPPPTGMADSVFATDRSDTSAQIRSRLTSVGANLRALVDVCVTLDKFESEARELDTQIKQLSQNTIALQRGGELNTRRGSLENQIGQLRKNRDDLRTEIQRLENDLSELRREEENLSKAARRGEQGQTLATRASAYRDAVAVIRQRAATQLRKSISEKVGELWVEITERGREFKGIEFDNHWNCSLIRTDGKRTSWDETNTSAGQRQVRLLAFYEALRRLARLVPPLVVDTPLGRLSKDVKNAVLDRLYLSGHQSIILATDSEIDPVGPLFDQIQDRLARVYTLEPHGEENSPDYEVAIRNDYFGRHL
jgi:DNA sulfur modification protein DndD